MNNTVTYELMGFKPPITLRKTIACYEKNKLIDSRIYVTYVDNNGTIIGFGGITNIDWNARKGDTYTFISLDIHCKGIGTAVNRLLISYAFRDLHLNKICSYIDGTNYASRRVREKLVLNSKVYSGKKKW